MDLHCLPNLPFTVDILKFQALVTCQKGLGKQGRPRSDCFWRRIWSGSSLFYILTSILWLPVLITKILFRREKCSKILEHLPYLMAYSKTCVKRPPSKRPKLVFKTNYCLMQVKNIAECSKGSIPQYYWPSLSCQFLLRSLFCLFLSGCFTQVLLYLAFLTVCLYQYVKEW